MAQSKPLELHQQELINVVKAAHSNLIVARKVKAQEIERRLAEARIQAERDWDATEVRIREDVAAEIAAHEAAQDEAVITAYEAGIPVRAIALDGFGNRLDGAVHQILRTLRQDGRVGNVIGYQTRKGEPERVVEFPTAVDVQSVLEESLELQPPTFSPRDELVLVEADALGNDAVTVPAITLQLDARDPWFKSIAHNARPSTPYLHATTCTLYLHPGTGELTVHESKELGDVLWDHPVARWVKEHPTEARIGFDSAIRAAGI